MKKNKKQIIQGTLIFIATLIIGFIITTLSFRLSDTLTRNQMRLLFTLDIVSLLSVGGFFAYYFESKKNKKQRENELRKRHNERIAKRNSQLNDLDMIFVENKFAA